MNDECRLAVLERYEKHYDQVWQGIEQGISCGRDAFFLDSSRKVVGWRLIAFPSEGKPFGKEYYPSYSTTFHDGPLFRV